MQKGCPLSPLLFALAIEPLPSLIRDSAEIQGWKLGQVVEKVSMYADDTLVYLADAKGSLEALLELITKFGSFSGLKVNWEKSSLYVVDEPGGAQISPVSSLRRVENFKYLGIVMHEDPSKFIELNICPVFKEMVSMDLSDSSQVYCAFLAYIDLIEVRNWHNVQILGSVDLNLVYLLGLEKADHMPQVIIPTPVTTSCSHERIQQYMKLGSAAEDGIASNSVLLAIVESDSTIVYYKLTSGFVIPDPPSFAEDFTNKRWKKKLRMLR
ncbi:tRNA-splicing endonuclease subunit Sen15 [Gastrophryne carolinensis]